MTIKKFMGIEDCIFDQISSICNSSIFLDWKNKELAKLEEGDLVIINNSFLFHDQFQTNKNPAYLCLTVGPGKDLSIKNLALVEEIQVNSDFKHISQKSKNIPIRKPFSDALENEINSLGHIIFILIGQVVSSEIFSEIINHASFGEILIDPRVESPLDITSGIIRMREFIEEDVILGEIESFSGSPLPDNFYKPFHDAYVKLRKKSYISLNIPKPGTEVSMNFLDQLAEAIGKQAAEYKVSLAKCGTRLDQNPTEFNNILRIAYDFESDAVKILRLLMSVCDLKPIILWMTLAAHHNLSEAFRSLPRTRDQNKPSLNLYREMIHGARNKAFHNLLPFAQPIQVDLEGVNIKAKRLRLFSEFRSKAENIFDFEDKQLIEILTEFTRSEEKFVTPDFWHRNYDVMIATQQLISSISAAIKALHLLKG